MSSNKTILLIGQCGTGKTWVMKQLIGTFDKIERCRIGLIKFVLSDGVAVLGDYDGSMFEGSDRLSMAVMSSCDALRLCQIKHNFTIVCEGDRFMNSTFISKMKPVVIKITDSGELGRMARGSSQTERHIKSVATRVANIKADYIVPDSNRAYQTIKEILNEKN